jgi:pimeloyl-ACP methyl ester carboxylesterase
MNASRRKKMDRALRIPTYAALEMLEGSSAGTQLDAAERFARETPTDDLREFVSAYVAAASCLEGVRCDLIGISRPWPFDLTEIVAPVVLWHGTEDGAAPIAMARKLVKQLPKGVLHELEGEGHFVLLTHADEVAAELA